MKYSMIYWDITIDGNDYTSLMHLTYRISTAEEHFPSLSLSLATCGLVPNASYSDVYTIWSLDKRHVIKIQVDAVYIKDIV